MVEINIKTVKAGIYVYRNINSGQIIYIGKDSDLITNRRHYDHNRADFKKGKRGQWINKVLQDTPHLFAYEQLLFCDSSFLDAMEKVLIDYYRPQYNLNENAKYTGNKKSKKHIKKEEPNG